MKTSPFLGVIAAGVLFGWFAPDFSAPAGTFHAESRNEMKSAVPDHSRRLAAARLRPAMSCCPVPPTATSTPT